MICTRDRAGALAGALDSVLCCLQGSRHSAELVVVDNGSTDSTPQVLRDYAARFPALRCLHEPRPGLSNARNCALRHARGEVLTFTDDDVRVLPGWIDALSAPLLAGHADAVAGGVIIPPALSRPWMQPLHRAWLGATDTLRMPDLVGANMAFHKRVLQRVPAFDARLGAGACGLGEDTAFAHDLARAGFRVVALPEAAVEHHFEPQRLLRASLVGLARKRGTTLAAMAFRDGTAAQVRRLGLRRFRAWLRLWWWRLLHPAALLQREGIDLEESARVSGLVYYGELSRRRAGRE